MEFANTDINVPRMKARITELLRRGNIIQSRKLLQEARFYTAGEESDLFSLALLYLNQNKITPAIELMEDKARLGARLILARFVGSDNVESLGNLSAIPSLPLQMIASHMAPPKPACARNLASAFDSAVC
jgi:hypothetical protein